MTDPASGMTYYVNLATGTSQWEPPSEMKAAPPPPPPPSAAKPVLPPGWSEGVDPSSGRTYYYNQSTRITTWTLPDPTEAQRKPPAAPNAAAAVDAANRLQGALWNDFSADASAGLWGLSVLLPSAEEPLLSLTDEDGQLSVLESSLRVMTMFEANQTSVLVTTVAATRGLDFPDGLVKNQKLAAPVLTPTTKDSEHDVPIAQIGRASCRERV